MSKDNGIPDNERMPSKTRASTREAKRKERDYRIRKERTLINRNIIRKESGYVLNLNKDSTPYPGKWLCTCHYGIPGHEIRIRIPTPTCRAHSIPSRSIKQREVNQ